MPENDRKYTHYFIIGLEMLAFFRSMAKLWNFAISQVGLIVFKHGLFYLNIT